MQFFRIDALKALPVLALLAAYAGAAFGVAGNVQFVIGDVKAINRAGATRVLQKGAPIDEGDRIVTGDGASAQIKMVDGGFIAVRPNTDMGFDTYRYAGKEDGTENAAISLLRGGFRTITGVIGRTNKQNYLVKTVTATIGIRGTRWALRPTPRRCLWFCRRYRHSTSPLPRPDRRRPRTSRRTKARRTASRARRPLPLPPRRKPQRHPRRCAKQRWSTRRAP